MNDIPEDDGLAGRVATLPVGVVIRRQPGVTRWAKWVWRAVAVLPGAGPADWHEMRRDGEAVEYHAGTVTLEVHRALIEGYRAALSNHPPTVYVILRPGGGPHGFVVHGVTASAHEAEQYLDSGDDIVEPVPMPPALIAWVSAFIERHYREEKFVKRARRDWSESRDYEGRGDPRVAEGGPGGGDVFRAPTARRRTVH
jgi:hypothetical protein